MLFRSEQRRDFTHVDDIVDGFGRSDSRQELRYFFEVNADYITYATLSALVDEGSLDTKILSKAAKKLNIDAGKSNPMHT